MGRLWLLFVALVSTRPLVLVVALSSSAQWDGFRHSLSNADDYHTEYSADHNKLVANMLSALTSGNVTAMKEAIAHIEAEAAQVKRNPLAKSLLGMRKLDTAKAFLYHNFSAQEGNLHSKMALAYAYARQNMSSTVSAAAAQPFRIHDGSRDNTDALRRFRGEEDEDFQMLEYQAAERGIPAAMYKIGLFYYHGMRGLRPDYDKALSWLSKAVEKGEPRSMELVGEIYARGVGVERNYTESLHWLTLASIEQLSSAYNRLGYLHVKGYGLENNNYTKSIGFMVLGCVISRDVALGAWRTLQPWNYMYLKGIGVKRDTKLACRYFMFAANAGQPKAIYQLAKRFPTCTGLQRNPEMATALYKVVAELGPWSSLSRWALGSYVKGEVGKAYLLYPMMAEMGYEVAQSNAAWILDNYKEMNICIGESGFCTDAERHQRANVLWRQASEQANTIHFVSET